MKAVTFNKKPSGYTMYVCFQFYPGNGFVLNGKIGEGHFKRNSLVIGSKVSQRKRFERLNEVSR